jgi:hypothetical protein
MKRYGAQAGGAKSFGERQFSAEGTPAQFWFDVLFGLVLPVVCVCFDPVVFRSPEGLHRTFFGIYAVFGYACFALGWVALLVWLVSGCASGVLCGVLAGGALFASIVGLFLLPLSVILLVVVIGIIGFAPFLTAFVLFRNCRRVCARLGSGGRKSLLGTVAGLVMFIGLPLTIQTYINRSIETAIDGIVAGNPVVGVSGLQAIKRYERIGSGDRLVWRYRTEKSATARDRIESAYRDLTGVSIEQRLADLAD